MSQNETLSCGYDTFPAAPQQIALHEGIVKIAVQLPEHVQVNLLEQHLNAIVGRHEILRTQLTKDVDGFQQVIYPMDHAHVQVHQRALESLDSLPAFISAKTSTNNQAASLRARLLVPATENPVLLLELPAYSGDRATMLIVIAELLQRLDNGETQVAEADWQYVDVADWLASLQEKPGAEKICTWWEQEKAKIVTCSLPFETNAKTNWHPARVNVSLRNPCQFDDANLFSLWCSLLQRYIPSQPITMHLSAHGRHIDDLAAVPGPLTRYLPINVRNLAQRTLAEVNQTVQAAIDEAILKQVYYQPAPSTFPEFGFDSLNLPPALEGLFVDEWPAEQPFKLKLVVRRHTEHLDIDLFYDSQRFSKAFITAMAAAYARILAEAAARPHDPLKAYSPISREHWHRLFQSPTLDQEQPALAIHRMFEKAVNTQPKQTALLLSDEQGTERQVSYQALHDHARRLAQRLREMGVRPEARIAVCMHRHEGLIASLLAVLKCGAVYVPIDPAYPASRIAFMLDDSRASIIMTQRECQPLLEKTQVQKLDIHDDLPAADPHHSWPQPVSDQAAYIIYTSGSTGTPKGVVITHHAATSLINWAAKQYEPHRRQVVLASTSICFDLSAFELFTPLCHGNTVVLVDNLLKFHSSPSKKRVTLINTVPSILEKVLEMGCLPASVTTVNVAGEAFTKTLIDRVYEQPGVTAMFNLYGPSEDTTYSTFSIQKMGQAPHIGRPLPGTQLVLVDPQMFLVPLGATGEIMLGGIGLSRGYGHRPALTAARFIPNPFAKNPGERLYRTGDLARFNPHEVLEFIGRIDHQIKLHGYRIELGEIEACLSQCPGVEKALVTTFSDATRATEHTQRLIAYLQAPKAREDWETIARQLAEQQLPPYMVPHAMIRLDSFPLTPNGKIDRKSLPTPQRLDGTNRGKAPRTREEHVLVNILSDLLGRETIGIDESFLALGGDSIISIQASARACQQGLDFAPGDLFKYRTIEKLVPHLKPSQAPHTDQSRLTGDVPLLPMQRWFFANNFTDWHIWNQSLLLKVGPDLCVHTLARAYHNVMDHHDVLRAQFHCSNNTWSQHLLSAVDQKANRVDRIDLSQRTGEKRTAELISLANDYQQCLDPVNGLLSKLVWFDFGPKEQGRLLWVIHHLVVDGMSWRILLEDLFGAYQQIIQAQPIQLTPKTSSVRAWAQYLRDYAESDQLANTFKQTWSKLVDTTSDLPLDNPKAGPAKVANQATCEVSLDVANTQDLLHRVPTVYNTQITEVLVAALATAISHWTGSNQVLLDLEHHGHESPFPALNLARTVGWFTNLYPVGISFSDNDPRHRLLTVKEALRAIPNQGLAYGVAAQMSQRADIQSVLAGIPARQIVFNYLGQLDHAASHHGELAVELAHEPTGRGRGGQQHRPHLLDFSAAISAERLHLSCHFCPTTLRHERIQKVCDDFIQALQRLIDHCRQPSSGGFSPADIPGVPVSQAILDQLIEQTRCDEQPNVESIYPLSPIQKGILFHSILAPGTGVYILQRAYDLYGLDPKAFKRTWQTLINKVPMFRTLFFNLESKEPLQAVLKKVDLPLLEEDWRHLDGNTLKTRFDDLLTEDRQRGFTFDQAPLMRLYLLQIKDNCYRFMWSHQHILLDGWSNAVVMNHLTKIYPAITAGNAPPAIDSPPYRHYIEWLQARAFEEDDHYWRTYLAGVSTPPTLPYERRHKSAVTEAQQEVDCNLADTAIRGLARLSQAMGITLNTIAQAAWAVVLSRHSGQRDILFGSTVSGRPHNLPGVERMAGPFINTVPIRTVVEEDRDLMSWLQELQKDRTARGEHEFTPLNKLQGFTSIPKGQPFLETNLVVENYPVQAAQVTGTAQDITIEPVLLIPQNSFPMTLTVRPRRGHKLLLRYDTQRFAPDGMRCLLDEFAQLLAAMISNPTGRIHSFKPSNNEERLSMTKEKPRKMSKFQGLRNARRKAVDLQSLEPVRYGALQAEESLPLLIEPQQGEVSLSDWARAHQAEVDTKLNEHGALLFRGFGINSVLRFHDLARALCPDLLDDYGDLPPEKEKGVYHSTPYPAEKAILFHNESSHTHRWPMKQLFAAIIAAETGGETPIVDCRKIYKHLDSGIIRRIEDKQLMYVRNFIEGLDVSWQQFFHTQSKDEVDAKCRAAGMTTQWDGNELRTARVCRGVNKHLRTGEKVFFNQIQLHHISCLDPEERASILAVYPRNKLPRNVYYGDGTDIEDSVVQEIVACYWELAKAFPWQQGDALLLDNMLIAHARNPFTGPRKVVVAMGDIVTEDQIETWGVAHE